MTVEIDVKFDRAINEETIPASTAEAVLGAIALCPHNREHPRDR